MNAPNQPSSSIQPKPTTQEDWDVLRANVTEAFSPGAPIQEISFFAGRLGQLETLRDTVHQRGRHAILFGERGVGKTSLVNVLPLFFPKSARQTVAVRVNASPEDTFTSLWRKVFRRIDYMTEEGKQRKMVEDYPGEITSDDVQLELDNIATTQTLIVVLDEFDRIASKSVTTQFADAIKALSDYSVNATIIIVGVAEDVSQLIQGHESIARSLVQVRVPRMSQDELGDVIVRRYKDNGLKINDEGLWKITFLSRGLPYYTHLMGMHAARIAIEQHELRIEETMVERSRAACLVEIDQSTRERYQEAIVSQRPNETLYEPVLLACALAQSDELGRFQQTAVSIPLEKILPGRNIPQATFAFHMNEFCLEKRHRLLERSGEARNYRYRFTDPMMQPFVILKGLQDGRINDEIAETFATRRQLKLSIEP